MSRAGEEEEEARAPMQPAPLPETPAAAPMQPAFGEADLPPPPQPEPEPEPDAEPELRPAKAEPKVDDDAPEAVRERRRDERTRTRVSIRAGALLTPGYLLMNTLAAVIASYGLLSNSPAVVIGAMIVALLLGPIMGVALALTDGELGLMRRAGTSLLAGGVVVYGTAALIGWLHANAPITAEITARTQPNLFDLVIALAGGAAGAYATTSARVGAGFVGVAIATALVPPLAASAILMVRGEFAPSGGAFLLAATNIIAIQFAAAVVLWLRGYGRDEDGKVDLADFLRRHAVSLLILIALAVSLGTNLRQQVAQKQYESTIRRLLSEEMSRMEGNQLSGLEMFPDEGRLIVRAEVHGPIQPSVEQVAAFAALIPPSPRGRPVDLRVRYIPTRIITPEGLVSDIVEAPLEGPPVGEP